MKADELEFPHLDVDSLRCPKCKRYLDKFEYISENDIFKTPFHIECECGHNFTIQARTEKIEWIYG